MNEVKTPKKNWLYYYTLVMLILFLFNVLVMPLISQRSVKEVDYGTFMSMTEDKNIGEVETSDSQILFTDKAETLIRQKSFYLTITILLSNVTRTKQSLIKTI